MLFDFSYKLNPGEKFVGLVRKHWFVLIRRLAEPLIIILLIILFVNKFFIFRDSALVLLVLSVVYSLYFVYQWILWRADYFVVTNERIIVISQPKFFEHTLNEISTKNIHDIFLKVEGLAATVFHFGNIEIIFKDGKKFKMQNVANASEVYQAIIKLKEINLRP